MQYYNKCLSLRRRGGDLKEGRMGNADYGGMVQPSQQHVVPCVKVIEWDLAREV